MSEGDVLLATLPQSDGNTKHRPVLCLAKMPPFGDLLVCGISTQLKHAVPRFDEVIASTEGDFARSGLKADSVIRLGYLAVLPAASFVGRLGCVAPTRLTTLRTNLADFLRP